MSANNAVGMNASGQFVILQSGDTLTGFANVAYSGNYADLSDQPIIPTLTSQLSNDSSFTTLATVASIYVPQTTTVNGHTLAGNVTITAADLSLSTVATTGAYSSLSGLPTIPASQLQSDWNETNSGLLDYIKNKPIIPAAQVNSDWIASSGIAQILNKPTIPSVARTTSTLTLSLVGAGATGTQISSTKDSTVRLTVSISTTSTIGGPSTSLVLLKTCATNSATEANWGTVATLENDQTITLAVALNSIQVFKGQFCTDVPASWWVKLVNSGTGTHTESFISGQQTLYG